MLSLTNEQDLKLDKPNIGLFFYNKDHPFVDIAIESITNLRGEPFFYVIDILNFRTLVQRFNIESLPTFILLKNQKERRRFCQLELLRKNIKEVYNV